MRPSWKGYLRLSLVSVPVQAFTAAATGGGEIHLNQLHDECHSRIRYKKVCPIHGEVSQNEIVSGYEYSKGQYVVVDPDELARLRGESERAISIETFISPDQIDPIYFEGRSYYLLPDGAAGAKPYAVMHEALMQEDRYGIAKAVFSGKDQLVLLRPMQGLLVLTMLAYESQVKPAGDFREELGETTVTPEELRLAKTLIEASTNDKFDFAAYQDQYTQKLTELIEAKVAGKEIVAPPSSDEKEHVINLMDALRRSVAEAKKSPSGARAQGSKGPDAEPRRRSKSPRKAVAGKTTPAPAVARRKSS
jgi:DNA end-binding protein Ku